MMEQHTEPKQEQETEHFETFEDFGEQVTAWGETFGEQMAAWGEEFGRHMEAWGREFERRMEAWGKEFGPRVEAWTEDLARGMEKVGKRVGEWFEEETATSATDAQSLREERLAILRMVEQGKITVSEAEKLLQALVE
jgi:DNA anti-recombination protein RmuC